MQNQRFSVFKSCSDAILEAHFNSTGNSVRFWPYHGGVAERLNALVLKTSEDESPPRVRISSPPPVFMRVVERFILGVTVFVKLPGLSMGLATVIIKDDGATDIQAEFTQYFSALFTEVSHR